MIAVDSSVWIDHFNGKDTPATDELAGILQQSRNELVVPDLVLFEVLRGFRLDREFRQASQLLCRLGVEATCDPALALQAARNARSMRAAGFTIASPVDVLLGTWCIDRDYHLLQSDADFDVMARLIGLKLVPTLER